jgi:hypothetical protein
MSDESKRNMHVPVKVRTLTRAQAAKASRSRVVSFSLQATQSSSVAMGSKTSLMRCVEISMM